MSYPRLLDIAKQTNRNAVDLQKFFALQQKTTVQLQKEEIKQEEKLIKVRKDVFRSLLDEVEDAKEENDNDNLGNVLGTALAGGLGLRALKGGKPKAPKAPKIPKVITGGRAPRPGRVRPRVPKVPKIGRGLGRAIPGLNIGLSALDFAGRKQAGQTNLQAGAGAVGGLAGALAGGKAGAALGAGIGALFGGVGAAPGALIGGLLGSVAGGFGGSALADNLTGVDANDADARIEQQRNLGPTKFTTVLDAFDRAITNLMELAKYFRGGDDDEIQKKQKLDPKDFMVSADKPGGPTSPGLELAQQLPAPDPQSFDSPMEGVEGYEVQNKLPFPPDYTTGNTSSTFINLAKPGAPRLMDVLEDQPPVSEQVDSPSMLLINSQPNTIIKPMMVGNEEQSMPVASSPSPFDNATKYAQMISSLTR